MGLTARFAGGRGSTAALPVLPVLFGAALSGRKKRADGPLGGRAASVHAIGGASGSSTVGAAMTAGTGIGSPAGDARSMSQVSCIGVGNGLDSASGAATKNTRTPHSTPVSRMTEREIGSTDLAARRARIAEPHPWD